VSTNQAPYTGKVPSILEEPRPLAGLEVDGGNLGLDFANTINSRLEPTTDYLRAYDGLIAWAVRVGLLEIEAGRALFDRARTDPRGMDRSLHRAHGLRNAIYRTFSAIAAGEPPASANVQGILRAYGRAAARGSTDGDPGQAPLRWPVGSTLEGVLDPVAYAAGSLLLAADRPTVKECPGCGWLFVDRSRNGNRRWCDMRTCGSRDKMRRYYYRSRVATREQDQPR
jgi:predicted RNA-binding Zn ribbon-like protein